MIFNNVLETIGNTPIIRLNKITKHLPCDVLAKVEFFNPGNSIKDRIALKLINDAEANGLLKPGGTIIEGTSGNTGMGLALVAIVRGYKCIFTTNDKQSKEKVDILRAVGAEVVVCPTNVSADDPRSYYSVARKIHEETPNSIYVNQYDNLSNRQAHYESTGPEIWKQTEGKITHLVVGVGTGGTISGTAKYLKEQNPDVKIIGVDTYGSILKQYHEEGTFKEEDIYAYITEGIGEDIIPENIDFSLIDKFVKVTDKDGAVRTRDLAKEEGLFVGYSGGSAIQAVLDLENEFTKDDVVVVILHDSGSRYVGKVFNDVWMDERGFLENKPLKAKDIIQRKKIKECITVDKGHSIEEAFKVMKEMDISQMPVVNGNQVVGSLSENAILQALVHDDIDRSSSIETIMKQPFPFIDLNHDCQEISKHINKENAAVMVEALGGEMHIITEYDLIDAIAG
ncbi:UNVERIFIED_CONTAM: hypothetical protein GTU68_059232 [Idotea baltica]|nr:hypothetical protein [Idotea baltica]